MKLGDFLRCWLILDRPPSASPSEAIAAVVAELVRQHQLPEELAGDIAESLWRREELGPTGIGEGVAIPHCWHRSIESLVGALAIAPRGLGFASLDGHPVHVMAVLVTPAGQEGDAAKQAAFEALLRFLRKPEVRNRLRFASGPEEIADAILAEDGEQT